MRTDDKRKITSRLNALKSTGPKTPEGKRRSAANSLKHGVYAENLILLPGENLDDLNALVQEHLHQWQPTNLIEEHLVHEMAITLWRLRRQAPAESTLIDIQLRRMSLALNAEFESVNASGLYALAVTALHSNGDGPSQISRQERRLLKQYQQLREEVLLQRQLFPPNILDGPSSSDHETAPPSETETSEHQTNQNETSESETSENHISENQKRPVETKLTHPTQPLSLLGPVTRVHNPHSPLYDSLPPLPRLQDQALQAA